jgi:Flp pilus assembly protein TadD
MRTRLAIVVFVSVAAALAQAQSESGAEDGVNFRGQVRYENNTPAAFIQVELWTDGESTFRTYVMTDRMGKFHAGAPCMVIQYKVNVRGYHPVSGRVDISIPPCRALESITLRAIPGQIGPEKLEPSKGTLDARVASIPEEAKQEFALGQKAVNNDDFTNAIPHLQKAIALYPKYAEAYQLLGVAQVQAHQGSQAEASLLKAIEIEDRMPRAQYLLGVLYAMTSRLNLAEKPLTRFAELDPDNPDAHFELAKLDFALNKFSDSEMHARKSIDLKEGNPGIYIVLGYSLLRQKKADDARQAFQQFLAQGPSSPMASDVKKIVATLDEREKK